MRTVQTFMSDTGTLTVYATEKKPTDRAVGEVIVEVTTPLGGKVWFKIQPQWLCRMTEMVSEADMITPTTNPATVDDEVTK